MLDDIAVLIPCYNEALTIGKVISDCKKYLPNSKIYVYDNNSDDDSATIAKDAGAIVHFEKKQGKGNVVRTMLRDVDAKCYVIVDADDTYDLSKINEMCSYVINDSVDMVVGDRLSSTYYEENKRAFHNFGNKLVLFMINRFFNSNVRDVMTGYRCLSHEFAKTFPVISKHFEIETEMTIHAVYHNMNIKNVVINYKDRPAESPSKLNTIKDGIMVIKRMIALYKNYKPFQFFTFIAIVLSIISTMFFVPVFFEFINTRLVQKMPTLIVCGFVYAAATLSFFAGVILSTIAEVEKRDYEHKLILIRMMKEIIINRV